MSEVSGASTQLTARAKMKAKARMEISIEM